MQTTTEDPAPLHVLDPVRASLCVERVHRAALRLTGSRQDAEDLAQETFVRVLARPRLLREDDELPYLLATMRNVHRSAIRTAGRRPSTVRCEDMDSLQGRRSDPHVTTVARQTVAAVAGLPATQREVVVAVDLLGLSYAETAAELRIPNGTVMSRLHRARTALARSESPRHAELES